MAEKTTKTNKWKQDKAEVAAMLDFYKQNFAQVYSVTCLENNHVIGVEVAPVRADGIILEKGRTFYNFKDLCLSVRRRLDLNDNGGPMYGYQCVCGNNTIMAKVESGEVATRTVLKNKAGDVVHDSGPVAVSTPYEMHQAQATIRLKQAGSKNKADYETDGTVERYETFKLERVK